MMRGRLVIMRTGNFRIWRTPGIGRTMPEGEFLKALGARLHVVLEHLEDGRTEDATRILRSLVRILPPPSGATSRPHAAPMTMTKAAEHFPPCHRRTGPMNYIIPMRCPSPSSASRRWQDAATAPSTPRLIDTADRRPSIRRNLQNVLRELAEISPVQYDLERDGVAQQLGIHALTLDRMVERARGSAETFSKSDAIDAFEEQFVNPEYLVDGLLHTRYLYTLTGHSNAGKTALAAALTCAVDSGTPFAGAETMRSPVLYLCGENEDDFRMRIMATYQEHWVHHPRQERRVHIIHQAFPMRKHYQFVLDEVARLGGRAAHRDRHLDGVLGLRRRERRTRRSRSTRERAASSLMHSEIRPWCWPAIHRRALLRRIWCPAGAARC